MSSAALEDMHEVSIIQTKQPAGWIGTPAEQVVDLTSVVEPTVVYEGSAREAAQSFPKNTNISAALALTTVGLDATKVRLIADPTVQGPTTCVKVSSAAGDLVIDVSGRPARGSQ